MINPRTSGHSLSSHSLETSSRALDTTSHGLGTNSHGLGTNNPVMITIVILTLPVKQIAAKNVMTVGLTARAVVFIAIAVHDVYIYPEIIIRQRVI